MKKCYSCGRVGGTHVVGCPDDTPTSYVIPTHHPKPVEVVVLSKENGDARLPLPDVDVSTESTEPVDIHKPGNTILPMTGTVQPQGSSVLHVQPMVCCVLHRLWVADEYCESLDIEGIRVGYTELLAGIGPVPASHFAMKYRETYPLATDFQRSLTPAHRVSLYLRSRMHHVPIDVRALFEVTIVEREW